MIFVLMARICCCIWPTIAKPLSGHMQIGLIKQPCCLCCHIWSDEDYQIDQFKALPVKKEEPEVIVEENVSKPNAWETTTDGNYLKNEALENSLSESKVQGSLANSNIQSFNGSKIQSLSGSRNQSALDNEKIQSLSGSRVQSALNNEKIQGFNGSRVQSALDNEKIQNFNGSRVQSALDNEMIQSLSGSRVQSALNDEKFQSSLIHM